MEAFLPSADSLSVSNSLDLDGSKLIAKVIGRWQKL